MCRRLGALGEFLGSIAVLVTLVYLALQTRQNTLAIASQLDAAALAAQQHMLLSAATSTELQEALAEDRTGGAAISQARRVNYWMARTLRLPWEFQQAQRGLLPSFNEIGLASSLRQLFTGYRSFESWWEGRKAVLPSEFVEFVEEQRAKAA